MNPVPRPKDLCLLLLLVLACPNVFADQTTIGVSGYSPNGGIRVPTLDLLVRNTDAAMRFAWGVSGGTIGPLLSEATAKIGVSMPTKTLSSDLVVLAGAGAGSMLSAPYTHYAAFGGLEAQYHYYLSFLDFGVGLHARLGGQGYGGYSWNYLGVSLSAGYVF